MHAIVQVLMPKFIKVSQGNDLRDIVNGFRDKWGFPQCVGAIDGTHVPIIAHFYNLKGFYSVLLQADVDYKLQFWDINVGWPGKVHDACVFRKGQSGRLFPARPKDFQGVAVPLTIIGDVAYPLLPWLQTPFADGQGTTQAQTQYNYRLSRARMYIERAFGRLKARWLCLLERNVHSTNIIDAVIAACCTLHNICARRSEALEPNLIDDDDNETEVVSTKEMNPLLSYKWLSVV